MPWTDAATAALGPTACTEYTHAHLRRGGSEGARGRTEPAGAEGRAGRHQAAERSRDIGVWALSGPVRVPSASGAWEGAGTALRRPSGRVNPCVSARERGGRRARLLTALGRCIRLRPGVTVQL